MHGGHRCKKNVRPSVTTALSSSLIKCFDLPEGDPVLVPDVILVHDHEKHLPARPPSYYDASQDSQQIDYVSEA